MDIQLKIPSPNNPAIEALHPVSGPLTRPSMAHVGRDEFIHELSTEPGVHAQVIRAVIRAFLAAALRGRNACTPDGWRSVIQDLRYVLGSALGEGVEQVRPVSPHKRPRSTVPVERQAPSRPPIARDPLMPIVPRPGKDDADLAHRQGLPVRFVHALVRAHVAARMRGEESSTPEGRSRILGKMRELVWDGILDAVKQVPCPSVLPPRKSVGLSRRSQPERER